MDTDTAERFERAIRADGRYPPAAYEFLHHGLEYTARLVYATEPPEGPRHVSGQQLCEGLRALALETWGPLAQSVLSSWNIRKTRDFGEMVFLLIELGLMGKQDSDRIEDFDDVYDFREAFGSYEIPLDKFDEEG
ncbi:MAG: Minf_1886 family protein [Phycisphaerae bacterium]